MSKSTTSDVSNDPWHVDLSDSDSDAPPKGWYSVPFSYCTPARGVKYCT